MSDAFDHEEEAWMMHIDEELDGREDDDEDDTPMPQFVERELREMSKPEWERTADRLERTGQLPLRPGDIGDHKAQAQREGRAGERFAMCDTCGSRDVHWENRGGRFVLINSMTGGIHRNNCKGRKGQVFVGESQLALATCKACGKKGLRRESRGTKWILTEPETGDPHEYWCKRRQETSNHETNKGSAPMRTMYDYHTDAQGNATPIFCMRDSHLCNTIKFKAQRFIEMRGRQRVVSTDDPMIAAMNNERKWEPKELIGRTKDLLAELNPYIQEALVRGGVCAEEAITQMQAIAGRNGRLVPPTTPVETTALEWDNIAADEEDALP